MSLLVSELRLNNLVYYNGNHQEIGKVTGIVSYVTGHCNVNINFRKDITYTILELKGIPLTVELLLKIGWVWNKETNSFEKYPNSDARMSLRESSINKSWTMFNYVLTALIAKNIFYVHQFQNLYFDLTGEELKIEL